MQGQTKIQERLRGIQSLIHEIEDARSTGEATINKLSQNNPSTIKQAIQEAEKEEVLAYFIFKKFIIELHFERSNLFVEHYQKFMISILYVMRTEYNPEILDKKKC